MLKLRVAATCFLILHIASVRAGAQSTAPASRYAGPDKDAFLLPNGWRLTPAGKHVPLSDLPLNILVSADGRYALVATSGYNAHELTAVELATQRKMAVQSTKQSWFGLALDDSTGEVWWSGGGA
ncbi:MAG: hypothetical protein ACYC6M_16425, partial [Terriglobales bacterium]